MYLCVSQRASLIQLSMSHMASGPLRLLYVRQLSWLYRTSQALPSVKFVVSAYEDQSKCMLFLLVLRNKPHTLDPGT